MHCLARSLDLGPHLVPEPQRPLFRPVLRLVPRPSLAKLLACLVLLPLLLRPRTQGKAVDAVSAVCILVVPFVHVTEQTLQHVVDAEDEHRNEHDVAEADGAVVSAATLSPLARSGRGENGHPVRLTQHLQSLRNLEIRTLLPRPGCIVSACLYTRVCMNSASP